MDAVKDYLISIVAASLVAGIATGITKKSGSISSMVRLLAGLFLTVTVMQPIVNISFGNLQLYLDQTSADADHAAGIGRNTAETEVKQVIIERSCAYILEKANALGADISVEVVLDDFIPSAVEICGAVSPNAKQQISNYITTNLGISTEDQQWIG